MKSDFTCEGCNTSVCPSINAEVNDDNGQWLMATLCQGCFEIVDRLPRHDPARIALVNRIVDFKDEWPIKAKVNGLGYAASLVGKDDKLAMEFLRKALKGNFMRAIESPQASIHHD